MRVDFGLFEGDDLLQKGFIIVTNQENAESFNNINIRHRLLKESAELTIEIFSGGERLIKSVLNMPIHEFEDWESIELAQFTFAFKCMLNA